VTVRSKSVPPSTAQILGPWIRILLGAWMYAWVSLVFILFCVSTGPAVGWFSVQGVLTNILKDLHHHKSILKWSRPEGIIRKSRTDNERKLSIYQKVYPVTERKVYATTSENIKGSFSCLILSYYSYEAYGGDKIQLRNDREWGRNDFNRGNTKGCFSVESTASTTHKETDVINSQWMLRCNWNRLNIKHCYV
jgi:hypothetical protein